MLFFSLLFALFGSSQSAYFQCRYFSTKVYWCDVQNYVNITSLDSATVDSISGTHKAGYNNDNVEAFSANQIGQIYYFPRGLNKFFKNLKKISIINTGLKEIHQSDLKDFPKLKHLYLYYNNLTKIEENLFNYNPNLELISLSFNKISNINPNVFDKLKKLKNLYFNSNPCINMYAWNSPTAVKDIITTAQVNCTNSNY